MSGKDSFLIDERKNIGKSVAMIEDLLAKTELSKHEVIALGTLLQFAYSIFPSLFSKPMPQINIFLFRQFFNFLFYFSYLYHS